MDQVGSVFVNGKWKPLVQDDAGRYSVDGLGGDVDAAGLMELTKRVPVLLGEQPEPPAAAKPSPQIRVGRNGFVPVEVRLTGRTFFDFLVFSFFLALITVPIWFVAYNVFVHEYLPRVTPQVARAAIGGNAYEQNMVGIRP